MKLICDKCNYAIATIDKNIKMPVQGSMFTSKDPKHGFPPPWSPVAVPEFMYCPMCNKRPFVGEFSRDMDKLTMVVMDEVDDTVAYELTVTDKGFSDATDELSESVDADTRTDSQTDEGGTAPAQDEPPVDIDLSTEGTAVDVGKIFAKMIESGEIVQKGSWFTYKGNNHRRDELLEIIGK